MRPDSVADVRPVQAFGSSRNIKGEENGLGANAAAVSPAVTKNDSVLAIQPVAPKPLVSSNTLVVTTSIASTEAQHGVAGATSGKGKSDQSPAFQAREAIAQNPALANLPLGRVVSTIARGMDPSTLLTEVEAPVDQTDPVVPAVEGEAPPIDIPATETSAPASSPAPSGDASIPVAPSIPVAGSVSEEELMLLASLYA